MKIAAVRAEERRAGFLLDRGYILRGLVAGHFKEELARERVAVGVEAGGGQPDEHVAGLDAGAGNHFVAVDRADDEAGQVVFAVGVEAGHLRRLAADEHAAVGFAGVGKAADDALDHILVELAGGKVVKKEERGCALNSDVIDAVIYQVNTHSLVEAQLKGHLELGPDAIGRADQDGVLPALHVEAVEGAEAADAA